MKKGVIMKKYKISIKKMKIYVNVVQDFEIYMKNKTKKLYSENCYSLKEFISLRKK